MLRVNPSKQVIKFLDKLTPKHYLQLDKKIQQLTENPFPTDCKKLKGFEKIYRVDAGEYRIIYHHDNLTLFFRCYRKA